MLHVFYIVSPITEIVSLAFIAKAEIAITDILFLYPKRYKPVSFMIKSIKLEATEIGHPASYNYKNPFKAFIANNNFINEISNLTARHQYHFYTPHLYSNMLDLLAHHPNCVDYSYIEEGALAYLEKSQIYKSTEGDIKVFRFKFFSIFRKKLKRFDDYSKIGIGIYDDVFPFLKRKELIKKELSLIVKNHKSLIKIQDAVIGVIVLDPTSAFKMSKFMSVANAVNVGLRFLLSKGVETIYYKLHPAQIGTNEEIYYKNLFDSIKYAVNVIEVKQHLSLESMFMTEKKLMVLHGISSLGLYAEKEGHDVFSYGNIIQNFEPEFKVHLDLYKESFNPAFIPYD